MAVRIRKNGSIVCAAMHPVEPGDVYIDDPVHYQLSVIAHVLVTDKDHIGGHGLWWWCNNVPEGINVDEWWLD